MLPDVVGAGPGIVANLARTGNGVEGPGKRPVARIKRLHSAADAVLGACEAGNDQPVVVQRRARDTETVLPAFRLHRPEHGAGLLVERHELTVQLASVDPAVAQANAAARRLVETCRVHPVLKDDGGTRRCGRAAVEILLHALLKPVERVDLEEDLIKEEPSPGHDPVS